MRRSATWASGPRGFSPRNVLRQPLTDMAPKSHWGGASGTIRPIPGEGVEGSSGVSSPPTGGTVVSTNEQDNWVNPRDPAKALGPDGEPARSRRAPYYADVPDEQWDDWRWQLSNRVNDLETFAQILELTDDEREGLGAPDKFRVDITPYFISLIDPGDPADPSAGRSCRWARSRRPSPR